MRLQLNPGFWVLVALGLLVRPIGVAAQSVITAKKLRYQETSPGITVDEDLLEAQLQFDNEDQMSLSATHDVVTGASPTGIPSTDTVTGASALASQPAGGQQFADFSDERWSYSIGYAPLLTRTFRLNTALHYGTEQDYLSRGATLGATIELNKKNTTLTPAVTMFWDRVMPSNALPDGDKRLSMYSLGIAQVLDAENLVTLELGLVRSEGELSDPYKLVLVGDAALPESRPDTRDGWSVQAGWRNAPFPHLAWNVALRHYQDDWGIDSQTLSAGVLGELGEHWLVELFGRHYRQTAADFFARSYPAGDTSTYRTSDLRLSDFSANTLGTTVTYKFNESLWLEGSVAAYIQNNPAITEGTTESFFGGDLRGNESEGDESESESDEHEGGGGGAGALLSATVYSIALKWRFF